TCPDVVVDAGTLLHIWTNVVASVPFPLSFVTVAEIGNATRGASGELTEIVALPLSPTSFSENRAVVDVPSETPSTPNVPMFRKDESRRLLPAVEFVMGTIGPLYAASEAGPPKLPA